MIRWLRAPLLAASLAALLPSCVVPIVQPAGTTELVLEGFPAGAERVEAFTAEGLRLRGVYVPAGAGAPLVLHLLPSEASVTTGLPRMAGWPQTLEVLQRMGFASLALDYRGVGASEGDLDPTALPEDGATMWDEALRRTGGDPGRVVVRAASLGTIPAAALLERGRAPRGWILYAPIRSESIASHAPRARHGSALGLFIGLFLKRPTEVDLVEALRSSAVPVLMVAAREDPYLPEEEREMLFAVAEGRGQPALLYDGDHSQLVARAYCFAWGELSGGVVQELLEAERAFLAGLDFGLAATPPAPDEGDPR